MARISSALFPAGALVAAGVATAGTSSSSSKLLDTAGAGLTVGAGASSSV